jgi:hypothetical protein
MTVIYLFEVTGSLGALGTVYRPVRVAALLGGSYRKTVQGGWNLLRHCATVPTEARTGVQQHTHILRMKPNNNPSRLSWLLTVYVTSTAQNKPPNAPPHPLPLCQSQVAAELKRVEAICISIRIRGSLKGSASADTD